MILEVPITGELTNYDHKNPRATTGNGDNPVRPLDFNKLLPEELCCFKWTAVMYDFERDMVIIDVTFFKKTVITEWDNTKDPSEPLAWRRESDAEFYKRQANTEKVLRDTFERPVNELYEITKEPRLKKP